MTYQVHTTFTSDSGYRSINYVSSTGSGLKHKHIEIRDFLVSDFHKKSLETLCSILDVKGLKVGQIRHFKFQDFEFDPTLMSTFKFLYNGNTHLATVISSTEISIQKLENYFPIRSK